MLSLYFTAIETPIEKVQVENTILSPLLHAVYSLSPVACCLLSRITATVETVLLRICVVMGMLLAVVA
jgi:hypothetical protein